MATKSKRAGWILVALLAAVGGVFFWLMSAPSFFSSPTASRDTPGYHSGDGIGLFEPWTTRGQYHGQSPEIPWSVPKAGTGENGSRTFEWLDEEIIPEVFLPLHETASFEGGGAIEFFAFATWHPKADDPVDPGESWSAPLVLRDPDSLSQFSEDELDQLGIPRAWRTFPPKLFPHWPWVRLFFRAKDMPGVRALRAHGGDARTGAKLAVDGSEFATRAGVSSHTDSHGEWAMIDMVLIAWHDTPLDLEVQLLTGEPIEVELPRELGAQAAFGEWLRVQWVTAGDGAAKVTHFEREDDGPSVPGPAASAFITGIETEFVNRSNTKPYPNLVIRASAPDFAKAHLGIRGPNGLRWRWDDRSVGDFDFLMIEDPDPEQRAPLDLVVLPKAASVRFKIAGMPDLPNPRSIENLFETRMPRVVLREDFMPPEFMLQAHIALGAQLNWDVDDFDIPGASISALPKDKIFRDTSPQQLLNWYLENVPGAHVTYDEADRKIYFNQPRETWWDRTKGWWNENKPSWMP